MAQRTTRTKSKTVNCDSNTTLKANDCTSGKADNQHHQQIKPVLSMAETLREKVAKATRQNTNKPVTSEVTMINGIKVKINSKNSGKLVKNFGDYEKKRLESVEWQKFSRILKNVNGDIRYDLKIVEFTPENQVKGDVGYTCKHRRSHCIHHEDFKKAFITWPFCSKQLSNRYENYTIPVTKREIPLLDHGSFVDVRDLDSNLPEQITIREMIPDQQDGAHIKLSNPSKVMDLLKTHFRQSPNSMWRKKASEEGVAFGVIYKMDEITHPKWKSDSFAEIIDAMKIVSNDEHNFLSQCITTIGMKKGAEVPLLFKVDKMHIKIESFRKGCATIPPGLQKCLSIISQSFGGPVY